MKDAVVNEFLLYITVLVSLSTFCADEHPLVTQAKANLDAWQAINKNVLALPPSDTALFFLECLSAVLDANFLGYKADSLIKAYKQQSLKEELHLAGYLAYRFDWQALSSAIYTHRPSMFFVSRVAPSDDIRSYVNDHFQTLQNIHTMLQNIPDSKQLMITFLALLTCEKKKQNQALDWDLLSEFEKIFVDQAGGTQILASTFGWKEVLRIMDKKEALSIDEYLIRWRIMKGKVPVEQRPLYFKSVALKELINYAKTHRCLSALIACTNNTTRLKATDIPPNRILDLSRQYLNSLDGAQDIPSPAQWQEINLNNNVIKEVPSMDTFVNLQRLAVSGNGMVAFPVLLGTLKRLKYLELCDNQIKDIPSGKDGFEELEELDVYGNAITELPELCFKKLVNLDVSGNKIQKMSKFVGSKLRFLKIKDNPIASDIFTVRHTEAEINKEKARENGNTLHIIG